MDHHLAHAASAYYFSGFDPCLVVTADGCGDGQSLTVSIGKNGRIERIRAVSDQVSAGFLYASVTAYLGFKAHRHEGKITGLAAFGDPEACYEHFVPCLGLSADKRSLTCDLPKTSLLRAVGDLGRIPRQRYYRRSVMNEYARHYETHLASFSREDVAAAAQKRLEDVVAELVQSAVEETGLRRVALAGGVFANVKLNQRLFDLDVVDAVSVHPSMGDGGTALGSAFLAHVLAADAQEPYRAERSKLRDVYLGPEFSDEEIERELARRRLNYRHCDDIEGAVADKLARFAVVGRFNGRMEYGPRALGNRSILAIRRTPSVNDWLNQRLRRTEFMPFAPRFSGRTRPSTSTSGKGTRRRRVHDRSPSTARSGEARALSPPSARRRNGAPARRAPRDQPLVPPDHREFKRRTGLGVVVNTSFNIHEEPIVCTPADACTAFEQDSVDTLAIGSFMVER